MNRKPQSLHKDIENGTVEELRTIINNLPAKYNKLKVWVGADTGEGYESLRSIIINNAFFCSLDGDEACGSAYTNFDDATKEENIPQEYTFLEINPENGVITGYKDILLLGTFHTENDIKAQKDFHKQMLKRKRLVQEALVKRNEDPEYTQYLELQEKMKKKYKDTLEL